MYYNDPTRIRIAPMFGVVLEVDNGDDTTTTHSWDGLEKESSWNSRPVTLLDRTGSPRIQFWLIEWNAYIPYNDLQTQQPIYSDLQGKPLTAAKLLLRGHDDQDGRGQVKIEVTEAAAVVRSMSVVFEHEKVEWRPRTIVRVRIAASKDLMDAVDDDVWYEQVAGWS